ncbi:DUF1281 domain-containing protein, partial [Shigella sonnei]|uniref:DUF1281 domain-containing protein n=1 Tax=Shigella sonnei TaxID=624 RepID=UPI000A77DC55
SVWWNRLCDNVLPEKTMPFDLLTVLPTRLDVEVNGFNGGVLNGVPSAYHWYTEQYGVKWPCGYDLNISSQGDNAVRKTTAAVFHGRPDPLPDAVNSPQAAGNGHHRGALPVPSVREGV